MHSLYKEKLLQAAAFRLMGTDSSAELTRVHKLADELATKVATGLLTIKEAEMEIR